MSDTQLQLTARTAAFLAFLTANDFPEATIDDITEGESDSPYEAFGREWRVLTDDEACAATGEYVKDSLWAFNAEFIASACGLPSAFAKILKPAQEKMCESLNEVLEPIIDEMCSDQADLGGDPARYGDGGIGTFAYLAAQADGRGHFLSGYDGEEHESTIYQMDNGDVVAKNPDAMPVTFYIYRTN